ncbi:MAG: TIGR01777 family oxidoreductase [Acidimicrobiales bacterium]|nr:TIGR01777 family oxidoreductase [Acidimicrobiales bacterium]
MRVAITGSTGLIGSALSGALAGAGHEPVPVVRRTPAAGEIAWNPDDGEIDATGFEGIDAVVHLAGAGIGDARLTDERKQVILESRTAGTGLLARTLADLSRPPRVLLSGSAIGIYGDRGDEILTETSAPGDDFLAEVCTAWEAATAPAAEAGIRTAHLRTGIVQSQEGGALAKTLLPFKLGLGGRLGSGRQWWSWISIDDEVRAILHLLDADVSGPVNLTGPEPVRNRDYTKALGRELGRPTLLPIPKIGPALLLGSELAELLLYQSQRVEPRVLVESGFDFRHRTIEDALAAVLGPEEHS